MPQLNHRTTASAPPLQVTYRTLESLKPDPQNARTHSRRQVDQIAASIRGFGFTNPILRDVNGVVIAGHGRLLAAKAIGLTEVPTIELVGLTEAQKRALRLADNKIALNAGWDLNLLEVEIAELSALDLDVNLTVTGFSTGELDILLGGQDPDDEVVPPGPADPHSKPGDVWVLGDHRIGDSRDLTFLREVVGEFPVDAAFLDLPTTSASAATRTRQDGTGSSPWRQAR